MATTEDHASALPDAAAGIYTETLARLYLKQGFVERALAIYRRLAQEQPQNDAFQERIRSLEHDLTFGLLCPSLAASAPVMPESEVRAVVRPSHPYEQVIGQLEQWLRQLQRQRQSPAPR